MLAAEEEAVGVVHGGTVITLRVACKLCWKIGRSDRYGCQIDFLLRINAFGVRCLARRFFALSVCGLRLERADKNRRVDPCVVQADVPVHVRAGGAAGGADPAEYGAAGQLLAEAHVGFR